MMMAAVSTITVILLGFFITCADLQDRCDFHVATNDNFNVPLNVSPKPNEQLKWTHKGTVIFDRKGIKVVAGKEDDVYQNGSLKLRNLDKNKAGIYIPEIYANGRKQGDLKSVAVCVQDRVSKPEVKIECSKPRVKFTCNVKQPAKDVNFEWFHNGKSLQTQRSQTLSQTILKGMEMDMFSCKVSNHVSSITSTTVKQNCTKPKPDTVFPKELLGINTWVFVGTGGGIVLVLIIVIVICCVRNRWKKRAQTKDEEELRLGWTDSNQQHHHHVHNHPTDHHQHHHHHRHHHQQQPAGHTGPRQHRSKQQRNQQHPQDPEHPNSLPQPNPRRPAQGPRPPAENKNEQPPPLPQPRKKAQKIQHH